MEWTEIAGVVALITGALGGVFTGIRQLKSDKFKQKQDAGKTLLGEYEKLIDVLRTEVIRVRKDCKEEIEALKLEHATDKRMWLADREILRAEIDTLRSRLSKLERTPPRGNPKTKIDKGENDEH